MTRTEEARHYAQLGETAYMGEKWQLAMAFMKTHPALEVRLTEKKFLDFWLGTDAPVQNFRATDSGLIRLILVANFVTGVGALTGIVALWWRRKKQPAITPQRTERRNLAILEPQSETLPASGNIVLPLAVYPVVFPCLYYVTHAYLRLRHPIDPVVMLLTAITVAAVWDAINKRNPKKEKA